MLSLSSGSLPPFRFPFHCHLYWHLGLSDHRLTYPPWSHLLSSIPISLSSRPSTLSQLLWFNLAALQSSTISLGVDYRLKDTYHQQDPPWSTLPRPTSDPPLAAHRPMGQQWKGQWLMLLLGAYPRHALLWSSLPLYQDNFVHQLELLQIIFFYFTLMLFGVCSIFNFVWLVFNFHHSLLIWPTLISNHLTWFPAIVS